jgi:hypothetical protein
MTRPNFLSSPGCWLRTPRTIQSRVDQACAVQHNVAHISTGERIAGVALAVVIGVVAASLLWHWLAS